MKSCKIHQDIELKYHVGYLIILRKYKNNDSEHWIIILEDDIILNYDINQLNKFVNDTLKKHKNPDIIVLGDRVGICGSHIGDNIQKYGKNDYFGCDCYAVKIHSINKIISFLKLDIKQNLCSIDNRFADKNAQNVVKIVPLEGNQFGTCVDRFQKDSDIEII